MRVVSFLKAQAVALLLAVCFGSSVAVNYQLVSERQDLQDTIDYLTSKVNALAEDGQEARALAVYWKARVSLVATERDNARRALETVWLPREVVHTNLRSVK